MDWRESNYSRDTAIRLARAGALVCIVCAPGACEVCQSRAGKIYTPSEVPRLPIRGCLNERCQCRFAAVDPESRHIVPELVRRGAQALKAGQTEQARQILRRAVALDEMYEQGWLWLSGAVDDDRERIVCMEKTLAINPRNKRAQAGLALLRKKMEASHATAAPGPALVAQQEPQSAQSPLGEPIPKETSAAPVPLPPEVIEIRQERKIIQEQWDEFMDIAAETDPQMLTMQGFAFLKKMEQLNVQALEMLPPGMRLDELQLQWQESEVIGESLADLLHDSNRAHLPGWEDMNKALRLLAQKLLKHRNTLKMQINTIEGQSP